MPRQNIKERKFICDLCDKAYSYQSGLCIHIKEKHFELYEAKMKKKGGRLSVIKLKKVDQLDFGLDDLLSDMKGAISKSETVKQSLESGKFIKEWIAVLVALLKGGVTILDGIISSKDKKVPVSDDIFKPLTENFIRGIEEYLFENVQTKEDFILKNIYEVHQLINELPDKLPFYTLEVRKLAEKSLRT